MKGYALAVRLACFLSACAQPSAPPPQQSATPPTPPPEPAPPPAPRVASEAQIAPGRWDVERVRCSDLIGAADEDREAAAMFYYGYLAAKAGIRVIDVNQIDGNVRKVMTDVLPRRTSPSHRRFARRLAGADDPQASAAFHRR